MKISLIIPNRDNLKYFKWSYDSIKKNHGEHEVFICSAVDACTDGTLEHYEELAKIDDHFSYIVNLGPERLGHTILYDQIVRDLVKTEIAMIWHCDMYLCPGALDAIEKYMYRNIYKVDAGTLSLKKFDKLLDDIREKRVNVEDVGVLDKDKFRSKKTIVSLTRIEPPLHPPGPEKILVDFGVEPEVFEEQRFLNWFIDTKFEDFILNDIIDFNNGKITTEGVFAPWAFWVDEFKEIGGHDPLFAPQSKEDSDIFNRFQLNGTKFIQTWEGYVYHMTCRGNRFNPNETKVGIDNPIWKKQNEKSSREFIRKWGHFVKHDEYMKPIVPPKYYIAFIVSNCTKFLLKTLEPWCSAIVVDLDKSFIDEYIAEEQTSFNLKQRIYNHLYDEFFDQFDIFVDIDGNKFTQEQFNNIIELSEIVKNSGSTGTFELSGMNISITGLREFQNDLIVCKEKVRYFDEKN